MRSIGDAGDYSILIATGAHPENRSPDVDLGRMISEVLLSPGSGADLDLMTKKLLEYSRTADNWGSRLVTVQLLRHLTSLPEPVRFQACGLLAKYYLGQEDCLRAITEDVHESPINRQEALRELKEQASFHRRLVESLRDPAQLTFLDAAGDSRRRLREEFQTMLLGSDTDLHERACKALKRYYPWNPEAMCSGAEKQPARR